MPNHVHAVVTPYEGFDLPGILLSWKTYSAKEVNKLVGRRGRFWQREYYDRIIRHERAYDVIVRYVLENPAKAGLSHWPFADYLERPCEEKEEVIA